MSAETDKLLAEAAKDYAQHNAPETRAEASEQLQEAKANATAAAASAWGSS
jgi:hypothetical protein